MKCERWIFSVRAWLIAATVGAGLLSVAAGAATAPESLATSAGCSACHAADHKILGPSYHDIAAKYHGDAKAPAALAAKVRSGGKGTWGPVPMPASDAKKISDADLGALIGWILKQ